MTWSTYHSQSEQYAIQAEESIRRKDFSRAAELYKLAAEQESLAFSEIDLTKARTLGITAVSATALWFKGRDFRQAQNIAYKALTTTGLPIFAETELKELLQTIWSEEIRSKAGIDFTAGEVLVSVKGGDVVTGGAPLELILRKVDEVSRIFYRTIEMLLNRPFRRRGAPDLDIQEQFRPWLFQAAPGSYQFAVRVERPKQMSLFPVTAPEVEQITDKFMQIIKASADDPEGALLDLVPNIEYRDTFMKLTRSLAPSGKTFGQLEIRSSSVTDLQPVLLVPTSRDVINKAIHNAQVEQNKDKPIRKTMEFRGILRGLQLDKDWLEINQEGQEQKRIRIYDAGEVVDDIVGPMVNHKVIVTGVLKPGRRYAFRDIQLDE